MVYYIIYITSGVAWWQKSWLPFLRSMDQTTQMTCDVINMGILAGYFCIYLDYLDYVITHVSLNR